ncbi:MAG: sugar ABC transporter ATP-binding protein [Actinomycetota bacterium]|nr:sugar ABC transporter ATP-binding protein [Actinomycetota bacterium]
MSDELDDRKSPVIGVSGLTKRFGHATVLADVAFELGRNEVLGLVGENGAGKSTLVKLLSGVYQPDEGQMLMEGRPYRPRNPTEAIRRGIATVHQELSLCENLTVAENLVLGEMPSRRGGVLDRGAMIRTAVSTLERLQLDIPPHSPVAGLPILQRQLVEIAKALHKRARVVILDEPTSALKEAEKEILFRLVRQLSEHASVIYISHYLSEVLDHCGRALVLRDGRVMMDRPTSSLDSRQLIAAMVQEEMESFYPKYNDVDRSGPAALSLRGVSGRVGLTELHDISFTVRRGEIVGLAGLSGSGAAELTEVLGGRGTLSGEVVVGAKAVKLRSPADAVMAGISYVPNDRKRDGLAMEMDAVENGALSVLRRLARTGGTLLPRDAARNVLPQLSNVEFHGGTEVPVRSLSGGNQQKVVFVKMANVALGSVVLVLNDFTRGVDVAAKRDLYHVIMRAANNGAAVLLASSDLEELVQLSDRIMVFRSGRIVEVLGAGVGMREVQAAIERTASEVGHVG